MPVMSEACGLWANTGQAQQLASAWQHFAGGHFWFRICLCFSVLNCWKS